MPTQRTLCAAATIAGALWIATSLFSFVGSDAAGPDPENARKTIEAILAERNDTLRGRLATFADAGELSDFSAPDARERASKALQAVIGPSDARGGAIILSGQDGVIAGFIDNRPATQAAIRAVFPLLQGAVRDARAAGGSAPRPGASAANNTSGPAALTNGTILVSVAAAALGSKAGAAPGSVVVAFKNIEGKDLSALGHAIGVPGLRFVSGLPAADTPALPILGANGTVAAHLVWDKPLTSPTLGQWALLLVQLAGGLGLLVFGIAGWRYIETRRGSAQVKPIILRSALDPKTNLPTDEALLPVSRHELERSKRTGLAVGLLTFELDGFASIAAAIGPEVADEIVVAFAKRVGGIMRSADTLFRLKDGAFAIVQTGVTGPRDIQALARRILGATMEDLSAGARFIRLGVSIGIALAPQDATTASELIAHSQTAMVRARQDGSHRFTFYNQSLDVAQQKQKAIEDDLRAAIVHSQLNLAFQPLVLADGETTAGVEALVRWKHPERGFIPPSDFIPIAEERGLIDALGEWVLRKACEEGRRWPGITVAVNVSATQFRKPGFVERVLQIVEETGFEPWRLELELTEGVVVDNEDAAEQAMMELRAAGIRLALDDFGTGYSSLIYLRRFAFDKIKIDKSFLDAMETTGESAILVHSVIHLGRALGLTVTAEGVETAEQHRFLQAAGCHQLQGYLFSKPVPAEDIDIRIGAGPQRLRKVVNG